MSRLAGAVRASVLVVFVTSGACIEKLSIAGLCDTNQAAPEGYDPRCVKDNGCCDQFNPEGDQPNGFWQCVDQAGCGAGNGQAGAAGVGTPTETGGAAGAAGAAPCGATCSGCCDGQSCVSAGAQKDNMCGKSGSACKACPAGQGCVAGACVAQAVCSSSSCPEGCCAGDYCLPGSLQDTWGCGTSGASCMQCDTGVLCDSGKCDPSHWSPSARFKLVMGVVNLECPNCDWSSGPDPQFCIWTTGGPGGCSGYCQDTTSCNFGSGSGALVLSGLSPANLTDGTTTYRLYDGDPEGDNSICGGVLQFPWPLEKTSGYYEIPASSCKPGEEVGKLISAWFSLIPE